MNVDILASDTSFRHVSQMICFVAIFYNFFAGQKLNWRYCLNKNGMNVSNSASGQLSHTIGEFPSALLPNCYFLFLAIFVQNNFAMQKSNWSYMRCENWSSMNVDNVCCPHGRADCCFTVRRACKIVYCLQTYRKTLSSIRYFITSPLLGRVTAQLAITGLPGEAPFTPFCRVPIGALSTCSSQTNISQHFRAVLNNNIIVVDHFADTRRDAVIGRFD